MRKRIAKLPIIVETLTQKKMHRVIALVQVRMSSSRLPGKALMPLCNRPILGHIIDRIRAAHLVDNIVIATSNREQDNCISKFCKQENVVCERGDEVDVCKRMYDVMEKYSADNYLRFCGDAPMHDPEVIDSIIRFHLETGADYTTNGVGQTRTFPLGIDVRIAKGYLFIDSFEKRDDSLKKAENPLAYVHNHLEKYKISLYKAPIEITRPELRFIADYPEDMGVLKTVFDAFYPDNPLFGCREAIYYVDSHPHLKETMNTVKSHLSKRISSTLRDASYKRKC
ncbi:NTP transferase domain-containing protein [bacterium]|nr:NTP transferase domain-containing protein [bacterium]